MNGHIKGCLLGTAVGDALGLPYEGISPRRAQRVPGPATHYRFLFGRGMVSDDTEHTCMVAQALISSGDDVCAFQHSLAWRLKFWLLGAPAGIGLATLKATIKLWIGFHPERSGVFSAGNGPAMRSAIIGAATPDLEQIVRLVHASTVITHTDPRAEYGAIAVAVAAHMAATNSEVSGEQYLEQLRNALRGAGEELISMLEAAVLSVGRGEMTSEFASSMGLSEGVSGYVYHTVPVCVHAWLSFPNDFRTALMTVIECGGDADTTAAIVGGIVGAGTGLNGIQGDLLEGLRDWPRTSAWLIQLADQLGRCRQGHVTERPLHLSIPGLCLRNLVFFIVVLIHGLRRLLPPY